MSLQRDQVFICYSRIDDPWRRRINATLAPLLRSGTVKKWDDHDILPGSDWRHEIDRALTDAAVGLCLVSADALASDFIMRIELPALLAAAERGELRLLWVLARDCLWQETPLARLQAAICTDRALAAMSDSEQDSAIARICLAIRDAYSAQREAETSGSGFGPASRELVIRAARERILADLTQDLAAAVRQLGETLDDGQRTHLERQISKLEAEIRRAN